jgi:hypothetical protein
MKTYMSRQTHGCTTQPESGPKRLLFSRPPVARDDHKDWANDAFDQAKEKSCSHHASKVVAQSFQESVNE